MRLAAETQSWFALQVRARWEFSTTALLECKGYETFLPTYKTKKRWNGKTRAASSPLFPGYVFCNFDPQKRLPILVTPGVLCVVSRGRVPTPVDDAEIATIQTIVSSGLNAEPWPYLEVGQRIRIEGEALHGLEGILTHFKGNSRIVVSVSLLRRSVALEIDRANVRPVGAPQEPAVKPIAVHPFLQGVEA
jgi:transcription antitermination factor NusG